MCRQEQLHYILQAIATEAKNAFGDQFDSVILYGSYARGDYSDESDIDVMVLVDMERQALFSKYRQRFTALTSRLSLEDEDCTTISLLLESKPHVERWLLVTPFYQNVMREGVRIVA